MTLKNLSTKRVLIILLHTLLKEGWYSLFFSIEKVCPKINKKINNNNVQTFDIFTDIHNVG